MTLQLKMYGGEEGGPMSEVGAFHAISKRNQEMRALLQALAADNDSGILAQATAAGTLKLRDVMAYQFSPYLTGTLRAAHRGEVFTSPQRAEGVIYIDPGVVNPVYGGYPAIYGMDLLDRVNWPEQAVQAAGQMVLDIMEQNVIGGISKIFVIS